MQYVKLLALIQVAIYEWVFRSSVVKTQGQSRRMNRFSLGTAQFGLPYGIANQVGRVSLATIKDLLQLAVANDIDMLDTAIAYGASETCLGEIGIQNFNLVTKLPAVPESCADVSCWVHDQIDASLGRLGVTAVFGLLLHRPDQLLGADGEVLYRALQGLKEIGQVQKIGVSIYAPEELEVITARYRMDLVQAPFNLVDRRLHTTGWLQRLKHEGIEIHTRSTFLQGLLLMPHGNIPHKFEPWNDLWSRWHAWLLHNAISAVQACLAFSLSYPEIDRVVVGVDSVNQMEQIISVAKESELIDFPDLCCAEKALINPAQWSLL